MCWGEYPPGLFRIRVRNNRHRVLEATIELYLVGKDNPEVLAVLPVEEGVKACLCGEVLAVVDGLERYPLYLASGYADKQEPILGPFLGVLLGEHTPKIRSGSKWVNLWWNGVSPFRTDGLHSGHSLEEF